MNDDDVYGLEALTVRASWHVAWMTIAKMVGTRSLCTRDQVGAVIVDTQQKIISTGYNGPPRGYDRGIPTDLNQPCIQWCPRAQKDNGFRAPEVVAELLDSGYNDCPALHAEANALMYSDASRREGGSIYVSSGCCLPCAKLIANSGLKNVHVPRTHPGVNEHRDLRRSSDFLIRCGLNVIEH